MSDAFVLAGKVVMDSRQAAADLDSTTDKTNKLGKAGNVAGKLLAGGLLAAAAGAVAATKAAAEDEAAASKLAGTLKNVAGATDEQVASIEDYIGAQGKLKGVADDELRPALDSLVTATKDVNKAQELSTIAMDVAAKRGVSLESVSKKLAKAYTTGNTAALAQYGIATKDAAGNTKSLEQVTNELASTYKGSASDAAGTAAGKQKILSIQLGELQEQIGTALIPVMTTLAKVGLEVVDWISQNTTVATIIIGTLGALLAVTYAVSVATKVWAAVTKVAAGAQAAFNAVMALNPAVLVVVAIVALAAALVLAYKKSETFRNIVNAVFGAVSKVVTTTWNTIKTGASTVIDFIKNNWQKLLAILTGPVGAAVILIVKNWDKIKDGFQTVKDKITAVVGQIKTDITNGFNAILSPIQAVIDKVQAVIDKIKSIPTPKLPDLNPFNGKSSDAGGPSMASRSSTLASASSGGQRITNVSVTGAVDPRSTAEQIATLLRRQGYRIGTAVR